jgi:hypothetical protein
MRIVASILIQFAASGLCAVALCCAPPALAGEPGGSPPPKPALTLQNFGRRNGHCLEWTNSCAVCTRVGRRKPARSDHPWSRRSAIRIACSTPGIACQPREIVCSRKRTE